MSENLSNDQESISPDNEDVLKILIATDNHLGFGEKDTIRGTYNNLFINCLMFIYFITDFLLSGDDSYITFEEILDYAVSNEVDMILLGGDLFHDANPTTNALNR